MLRRVFGPRSSDESGLTQRDKAMFDEFRKLGTDFARPRHIDHFFVLHDEDAATRLSNRLSPPLECNIHDVGGSWTVEASLVMPLSEELIQVTRPRFEALAKEFGGTYDGWGAEGDGPS